MLNIPDNLSKIYIGIGIVLMAYSYLGEERERKIYNSRVENFDLEIIKTNEQIEKLNMQLSEYTLISNKVSKTNNIKNPLQVNDSVVIFEQIFSGSQNEMKTHDSLFSLYLSYKRESKLLKIQNKKLDRLETRLDTDEKIYKDYSRFFALLACIGILFFLLVLGIWKNSIKKNGY